MDDHVRLQRAHEQQRERARIAAAHGAGVHGALEVAGDDRQSAPRRTVSGVGVERNDQRPRPLVHVDGDVLGDELLGERDEALGDPSEHDARIGPGVEPVEIEDEIGRGSDPRTHRGAEELLLRARVPQHRRGRDAQLAGDVGERGRVEAFRREHVPRRLQQLLPRDPRRPSHL